LFGGWVTHACNLLDAPTLLHDDFVERRGTSNSIQCQKKNLAFSIFFPSSGHYENYYKSTILKV